MGLVLFGHLHHFEPEWERFSNAVIAHSPAILAGFALLVIAVRIGVPLLAGEEGGVAKPCGSEGMVPPDELGWLDWIDRVTPWLALALAAVFGLEAISPGLALPTDLPPAATSHTWGQWACLSVLILVFLVSYFRVGPRGMLAQLFPFEHDHGEGHGHHDHHDHA